MRCNACVYANAYGRVDLVSACGGKGAPYGLQVHVLNCQAAHYCLHKMPKGQWHVVHCTRLGNCFGT